MSESFLDWEKNLKKEKKEELVNTLGISARKFKAYMKEWREKNIKRG